MNKAEKKEIRRALCGRIEPAADGRLQVLPAGDLRILGVGDGADAARLFGVMRRGRVYASKSGRAKVTQLVQKGMQNIGRGLILSEQPETLACRIRYILTPPVVLTFRYEQDAPTLTAWTGRSLLGLISLRRAINALEKQLPEELRLTRAKAPKEPKEQKEKKRKEPKKEESKDPEEPETEAVEPDGGEPEQNDRQAETEGGAGE